MDFKFLNYYIEIVKLGNISKAAKRLHIAQPALSQILKKIELDLGTTLIERYKKKWEVTETGKVFYQYAMATVKNLEDIKKQIVEMEEGMTGTIRLGVAYSCVDLFIDYFSPFSMEYPQIKISLIPGSTEEVRRGLEEKNIDLAIILKPEQLKNYEMKILKTTISCAIVPKKWEWNQESITLQSFHQKPFILLSMIKDFSMTEYLMDQFKKNNIEPNIILECKDIPTVIQLVEKGLGTSILPKMNWPFTNSKNVDYIPIEDFKFEVSPVLIKLKDNHLNQAAEKFWDFI